MATSRPTPPARASDRAGSLARAFAEQRTALLRYTTRVLDGDAARAESVAQAARDELLATPPEPSESDDAELCFAACRTRAQAFARQEDRAKRFVEPPAGPAQAGIEEHTALLRHIERLTPKQQEVLRLKFQNGFGQAAIARITELPADKVGGLIHTALARLRAEFPAQAAIDDPRVTASVLGEQTDSERAAFTSLARDDPSVTGKVAEIRAFVAQVEEALGIEAGVRTPRRVKGAGRTKKIKLLRFPALWFVLGGALAAGVGAFFILRPRAEIPTRPTPFAGDFKLKPASWQERPAETEPAGSNFRPDVAAGGRLDAPDKNSPAIFPPLGRVHKKSAVPTAPNDGPTTGEPVPKTESTSGPPDVAAAMGGKPAPTGAADTGGPKSFAPANAPVEKIREQVTPAPSPPPEDLPSEKNQSTPSPPSDQPRPARIAKKGPGAKGGGDFRAPSDKPVSALPSDTDMASVPGLLKSLGAGEPPASSAVRAEELLNYFPTADAAPETSEAFSAAIECAEAPWNAAHRLVRIGLKGRAAPPAPRARANLVFLVDVSGSMDLPARLPLVQEAMRLLLERLRPDDRVAIVTYAGESQLMLPSTPVSESARIRHVLGALHPAGQTNGGAGIQLAYTIAKAAFVEGGANRVILCTDGDFNVGLTSADALTALAAEQAKAHISLSVFGFGRGHQIDARLEALAAQGQGRSGYVNSRREAEQALAEEVDGLFAPIARDVRLEVAFDPARVAGYRLIGYEPRELDSAAPDPAAATVIGSGHTLTALYEIIPSASAPPPALADAPWLTFRVDYQEPSRAERHQLDFPLEKPGGRFADASGEFKFSAAVAGFAHILSDSPQRGTATLPDIVAWAEAGRGDDPAGYRSEFIELVRAAQQLAP